MQPKTASILDETVIPLSKIPAFGRPGKFLAFATGWRWATRGLKAPNGETIRLEVLKAGSKLVTSREALERFFSRLTPTFDQPPPAPRTSGQRKRAAERAGQKLAEAGA
jgi:hypothetical protein